MSRPFESLEARILLSGTPDDPFGSGPLPPPPGPDASGIYSATNVPLPLVDDGMTESLLLVPDSFIVTDVDVSITLSHTFDEDLEIRLISPDGTAVELLSGVGAENDNFDGTTLDDESPNLIDVGDAPFAGAFAPIGFLQDFDGKNAQGTWRLQVTDTSGGDTGILTNWSLTLRQAPTDPVRFLPLGVSSGVSWFGLDAEIANFGQEDVYAVELEAGQRISASVQTPDLDVYRTGNADQLEIPDDQSALTSTISVPDSFPIADLDVQLLISHEAIGELDIFLVTPGGDRIELSTNNGGAGSFYFNTSFDDEASENVATATGTVPLGGRWRPESPLSIVDGADAAGDWALEITDDSPLNTGTLLGWGLRFNEGLDSILRFFGPQGELAANDDAALGVFDSAIVSAVVPVSGTYYLQVGTFNYNVGAYEIEIAIYDPGVPDETGDVMNLDAARTAANGNGVVLGQADGILESDVYETNLNAGESVVVAVTTPGGFFDPIVSVTGPGNFSAFNDDAGPSFDSVLRFTAPATGLYTITVEYASDQEFLDTVSQGSYALTVAVSDNATNNDITGARPISVFDYRQPMVATSGTHGVSGIEGLWIGEIDAESDVDYFSLGELLQDELIGILAQRRGSSQLFAEVVLVNSAGEIVTSADTTRSGTGVGSSRFEFILPADGTYYARVEPAATQEGGSALSTGAYALFYADFGRFVVESEPPQGTLVFPAPGSLFETDMGYVEIAWTDSGGAGIRTSTIDPSDVVIAGVMVTSVEDRGNGLWRYSYSGVLPPSTASVVLPAGSVSDLSANANLASVFGFSRPPLGTAGDDVIWLEASDDGTLLEIYDGDPATSDLIRTWPMSETSTLYIDTLAGDDQLVVRLPLGTNGPFGWVQFNAGAGNNSLLIESGGIRLDSVAEGGVLNTTIANQGRLTTRSLHQNELTLAGSNSRATILPGGDTSVITSLNLATGAVFDITDNALVVDYSGPSPVTEISSKVLEGRGAPGLGSGAWTGTGITSSTAATANAANPESQSIAIVENAALPLGPYATFRGQAADDTAVLIAYTRTADANLDGTVNDDDVTILGATYAPGVSQPAWALGDFDFNGFVDDDDVTLLGVFYTPNAPLMAAPPLPSSLSPHSLANRSDAPDLLWMAGFQFATREVPGRRLADKVIDLLADDQTVPI